MPRHETDYDVVIAGGGAGGVGAALGAAKAGARVALVEKYGFLGGAATNAQVLAYCGFYHQGGEPVRAVAGAGEQVLAELRGMGVACEPFHSPTTSNWIVLLDPEKLKVALDRVLSAHGVDVYLHARVAAASRTARALESVTVAGMDGRFRLIAESFVDASGDANLALVSGVPMRTGDSQSRIQAYTMPLRIGGLAPDTRIDRARMQQVITEFNRVSPHKINRTDAGIFTRVPGTTDFWWLVVDRAMPDLSSNSFTRAEQTGREMSLQLVDLLRASVPGFENAWLAQTGPQIGVRETRHPAARYDVTRDDVVQGRLREDGIARAAWPIELHSEAGKPIYEHVGGEGFFHVPYDALRARDLDNLWYAGRVIGADDHAYGSIRVMGTAFATGEAAGVAAALGAQGRDPVTAQAVRRELLRGGALI
ncbi:FAD-dependent oxidoreductase [Pseudooceanicola algae]|uniref:Soluble pyridine nucleotide transhydrogenase n=1 Tax=Pseudooceanicola algae TaxID=1537215 RepID=A0A418SL20_9RHOB|nr:FAD-dependent oxidoreductase [Pseudooceanicola algae]QPM90890.1 Soluble pyridine nucleotide transhydrogenase [Pseudooceanicola algae]